MPSSATIIERDQRIVARRSREESAAKTRGVNPWTPELADQVVERYACSQSATVSAERSGRMSTTQCRSRSTGIVP
jgi:hypothetical protein